MLRLNLAIPPTVTSPNRFEVVGGDVAGFPNGRCVIDDVVSIELRVVAGLTYPLVATYTADDAAGILGDGTANESAVLPTFPYLAHPTKGTSTSTTKEGSRARSDGLLSP